MGRRHGGKGAGRSRSIRRRISANRALETATSSVRRDPAATEFQLQAAVEIDPQKWEFGFTLAWARKRASQEGGRSKGRP